MPDMLVKLYNLPAMEPALLRCASHGISIKRALMPEMETICQWVQERFGPGWASECRGCFSNRPLSLFLAYRGKEILGFACYDSTCRDFFGPTGVEESLRGKGAGAALLLACLHDMASQGYAYAIIGGAGPVDFYEKVCGATVIEGSVPGIYRDML
jgi:predicted GNAT family acetyltransferase